MQLSFVHLFTSAVSENAVELIPHIKVELIPLINLDNKYTKIQRFDYHIHTTCIYLSCFHPQESFLNTILWLKDIEIYSRRENMPIILVGNKCDLKEKQVVDTSGAQVCGVWQYNGKGEYKSLSKT